MEVACRRVLPASSSTSFDRLQTTGVEWSITNPTVDRSCISANDTSRPERESILCHVFDTALSSYSNGRSSTLFRATRASVKQPLICASGSAMVGMKVSNKEIYRYDLVTASTARACHQSFSDLCATHTLQIHVLKKSHRHIPPSPPSQTFSPVFLHLACSQQRNLTGTLQALSHVSSHDETHITPIAKQVSEWLAALCEACIRHTQNHIRTHA
jgi:hypothetical protein